MDPPFHKRISGAHRVDKVIDLLRGLRVRSPVKEFEGADGGLDLVGGGYGIEYFLADLRDGRSREQHRHYHYCHQHHCHFHLGCPLV